MRSDVIALDLWLEEHELTLPALFPAASRVDNEVTGEKIESIHPRTTISSYMDV
jgi:hypothetical protein